MQKTAVHFPIIVITLAYLLLSLTWGYAQEAKLVASRNIRLEGKICIGCNMILFTNGAINGSPKFFVLLATEKNIYEYCINDATQKPFSYMNDAEANKQGKGIKRLVRNQNKTEVVSVDEETIKIWNHASKQLQHSFNEKLGIYAFAVSNNSQVAYAAFKQNKGSVNKIYNYANKKIQNFQNTEGLYEYMEFSPDGKYIIASGGVLTNISDGTVIVLWDATTGKVVYKDLGSKIRSPKFSSDSKHFYYIQGKQLVKCSIEGKRVFSEDLPANVVEITPDESGEFIYTKDFDNFIRINAQTGRVDQKIAYKFPFINKCIFAFEKGKVFALIAEEVVNADSNLDDKTGFKLSVVDLY